MKTLLPIGVSIAALLLSMAPSLAVDIPDTANLDATIAYASRDTVKAAWAVESDGFVLTNNGIAETLTHVDFDGNLQPGLAAEWTRVDDLTWDFTLRDGVTFQDGTPLDAAAVAGALNHLLTLQVPARAFGPSTFASVTAVDGKVRIVTVESNALVPHYLAAPATVILAPKAYAGAQIDPVGTGTGPFALTAANLPQSFTLKRNDNYWGGQVGLAGAEVHLIPDGATRATQLQTGEAQITTSIPNPVVPLLETNSSLSVERKLLPRTGTLYLNNARAPLSDVRVRQAIQAAIDAEAIAGAVLGGNGAPASGPFNDNWPWAPEGAEPIKQDLDKAKALLAEAGIAEGSLTLQLWTYPSRAELPDVAVAVQEMLKKVGIAVEIRVADYAALEGDALAGNYDMMLASRNQLSDVGDPISFLRSDYTCKASFNFRQFCDPAFDEAVVKAAATADDAERYAIYADLATQLQQQAVDIYIYYSQEITAHSGQLQNVKVHPLEQYLLTQDLYVNK